MKDTLIATILTVPIVIGMIILMIGFTCAGQGDTYCIDIYQTCFLLGLGWIGGGLTIPMILLK